MQSRRTVFAAACIGMLIFGIVFTVLGALLPSVIAAYGIDNTMAGSLFSAMSVGILVGSIFFGPVVDRFGYKGLLVTSVALIAAGLEVMAAVPSFGALRAAALFVGTAGGVVNGATNALVADISEGERSADLSILGIFFGLGAFGVPFTLGSLLDVFSYANLLAALGGLVAASLVYFLLVSYPQPKQAKGLPIARSKAMLRDPVLLLFGAVLFLQSGMEITTGGWSAAFFNEVLAVPTDRSVLLLSLFWVGMVSARLVLSVVLRQVRPSRALWTSMGVALVGSLLMVLTSSTLPAAIGLLVLGGGLAAGFPVVLGYVGDRYADLSGTAFSVVMVMALAGGSALPFVTGVLGDTFGLRSSFLILPSALVLMALVLYAALHRMAKRPSIHSGATNPQS